MKRVYCISPDYLHAIVDESRRYTFEVQGYSDIYQAIDGFISTSFSDISGFIYLSETLLEEDVQAFNEFFFRLNMILGSNNNLNNFSFIFVVNDDMYLSDIISNAKQLVGGNITFMINTRFINVTDTLMKDVFGAMIKFNMNKTNYIESVKDVNKSSKGYKVNLPKFINQHIVELLGETRLLATYSDMINNDIPHSNFKYNDALPKVYTMVRKLYLELEYLKMYRYNSLTTIQYKDLVDNRVNEYKLEEELNRIESLDIKVVLISLTRHLLEEISELKLGKGK